MNHFKRWLKTITFYEILVGMAATMKHLLRYKPITLQYPHEKRVLPDNYRGMLALLRYDDGTEKCVGCDLCEAACPSRVIRVVSAEVPGEPTKRYSKEYYMDMTRCLFCGMCVDACPVDALGMTGRIGAAWSKDNAKAQEWHIKAGDRAAMILSASKFRYPVRTVSISTILPEASEARTMLMNMESNVCG